MTDEERKQRQREAVRRYKERHPEVIKAKNKRYRAAHPDKVRMWRRDNMRKYRENNPSYDRDKYLDLALFTWNEVEGFDGWTVNTEVHHRLEMFGFSMDELKAQDRYYNCTPDELICMSLREHNALHTYLRAITKKNP